MFLNLNPTTIKKQEQFRLATRLSSWNFHDQKIVEKQEFGNFEFEATSCVRGKQLVHKLINSVQLQRNFSFCCRRPDSTPTVPVAQ
jgi:hypothetical protein